MKPKFAGIVIQVITLVAIIAIMLFIFYDEARPQTPGDSDGDNVATIGDAVWLINYIFAGGPPPKFIDHDSVKVQWRYTGIVCLNDTILFETNATEFRIIRTPQFGDSIPDFFEDVFVVAPSFAGYPVNWYLKFPRNGMWYKFDLYHRIPDSWGNLRWIPLTSKSVRSCRYEVR